MEHLFWMVWKRSSQTVGRQHPSYDKAIKEARRLAAMHPGEKFYTLMAQSVHEGTVTITDRGIATQAPEDAKKEND